MLDEVLEELSLITDEFERYSYLASKASEYPELEGIRTEENRVPSCTSPFWIKIIEKDGRIYPYCYSDSVFVHGAGNIICSIFFGMRKDRIGTVNPEILEEVLLRTGTDAIRARGLRKLFDAILLKAEKE